jgi:regulator of RNase E activity RraA
MCSTLNWYSRGMTGVVTNGNCRDTDELILEKIPVYTKYQGGGTRPGRIESGALNTPIVVGGVVVPREQLDQVADIVWDIARGDKAARRKLYEKTNQPADATVK